MVFANEALSQPARLRKYPIATIAMMGSTALSAKIKESIVCFLTAFVFRPCWTVSIIAHNRGAVNLFFKIRLHLHSDQALFVEFSLYT